MFALISPNEQRNTGVRVAQVSASKFEVAKPLFWVQCGDDITPDHFYDLGSKAFSLISQPAPDQPSSTGTQEL